MTKKGILLLIFLFLAEAGSAFQLPLLQHLDSLVARSWSIEDGLPVNSVNWVQQDSLGYLWIATYDGLVRFDGLNFEIYNYANTPGMPHNRATQIHIQKGVGMWVALEYGGVMLIKDGSFHHFGNEDGFTNSDITKIYEASDGRVFFITLLGLYVYEDGQFSRYFKNDADAKKQVRDLIEDDQHTIWVATNSGLIHIPNEHDLQIYTTRTKQEINQVITVHQTQDGTILAGTSSGVYELHNNRLIEVEKYKLLKGKPIMQFYEDAQVMLYFTKGAGYIERGNRLQKLTNHEASKNEFYDDFLRDQDGSLWMVGNSGSIRILKGHELKRPPIIEKAHYNSISKDREGNIWISSNAQGLISISKSRIRTIGKPEGLSGSNILALLEEKPGKYWVGTRGDGLNIVQGDSIHSLGLSNGLRSSIVQALQRDDNGNIWVGYYQDGLDRINASGITHFMIGDNLEINDVHAIFQDSKNNIWLGTYVVVCKNRTAKQ